MVLRGQEWINLIIKAQIKCCWKVKEWFKKFAQIVHLDENDNTWALIYKQTTRNAISSSTANRLLYFFLVSPNHKSHVRQYNNKCSMSRDGPAKSICKFWYLVNGTLDEAIRVYNNKISSNLVPLTCNHMPNVCEVTLFIYDGTNGLCWAWRYVPG